MIEPDGKKTIFEAALETARPQVDLVALVSIVVREAIRLGATSVHMHGKEGGRLDWKFQDGSVASESIPLWMCNAIRESQNELLARVGRKLKSDGFSTSYLGSQFKVSSSEGVEMVLEIGD